MAIDQSLKTNSPEQGFDTPSSNDAWTTLRIQPGALRADGEGVWRALVLLAIHASTTPAQRRQLTGRGSAAVIVRVPTAAWVAPVAQVLRGVSNWAYAFAVAVPRRPNTPDDSDRVVSEYLAEGGRVLGVSQDPARLLPRTLVMAADLTVRIEPPDAGMLSTLVRIITGRRRPVPSLAVDGLDLDDIVAAIRRGSTFAECEVRLDRARAARQDSADDVSDAPDLADLHGYGAAMEWSKCLIADLAEWRAGRTPFPTGSARVVLAGPPGTGKTSLVRSIAKASALPLVSTSMARFFADGPGYLDSVIKAIDSVFAKARALAPAILFLDEMDGVPDRATMSARAAEFWTPVVGHLLTTLDGTCSGATRGLVVIGATNYENRLDSALVRPGRLERVISIRPLDDPAVRADIVRSLLRGDLGDTDLSAVGLATAGATGAMLMALVRDARRRARVDGRDLTLADLLALAVPPDGRSDEEDRRCAVHEAGHAVVACALGVEVKIVSMVSTSTRAAAVHMAAEPGSVTRASLEARCVVYLSGMAAEETIYGDRSIGSGGMAGSDLAQATQILIDLHAIHGLGERLTYSPPYAAIPDPRLAAIVERDLQRLHGEAKAILARERRFVDDLTERLLADRVLSGDAVRAIRRAAPVQGSRARRGRSGARGGRTDAQGAIA